MIQTEEVIKIHKILIDIFGGIHGLRDKNALDSALNRPFMTFDHKDLYQSTPEKAAALIESIISNHPFIDGNKRIGYVLMRYLLLSDNIDLNASQSEKYEFVLDIAHGNSSYNEIRDWIIHNSIIID